MADIINLNKARKAKRKEDEKARSEENRVRFGLSKGQMATDKSKNDRRENHLDGLRIYRPENKDDEPS